MPPTAASPESASRRPRQEEKQSCLPVTIRAIEAAVAKRQDSGDELNFFGLELSTLIVVAVVENVVRQSTGLEVSLNDGTGRIKARYFCTDPQPGELERIAAGTYISACGNVRAAPALHFAINGLKPIESADEVSYHMIEVAHAMLSLQQPAKVVAADTSAAKSLASDFHAVQTPQKEQPGQTMATPTPLAASASAETTATPA